MKSVLRVLIAIAVVSALVVGRRDPRVSASSATLIAADITDREALVALYQAANGANWLKSGNWLTDAPIHAWHGVVADESGRAIFLDLRENGLRGSIPSELGNLANLEFLNLSGNELSGSMPPALGDLANLKWLDLKMNELSGSIPPTLGKLTDLAALDLSKNRLSGSIPSELGKLTGLAVLYLSENELSGTIPSELGNANLRQLSLSENRLSGTIPSELGDLASLTVLNLGGNELNGSIPSALGALTNLAELSLASNQLNGEIPPELGNLTNLGLLRLAGNRLSGCVPEAWRNIEENDIDSWELPFCVAPSPTPTAIPETLTTVQIFQKVSPAIAFVNTETRAGSGVLLEGGYLVTNAHVVWPFDAARVVFPDGTEFEQVAVKGWDLLADLAVLGPIDVPAQPMALLDGENIPIGSDMYLIGYPGEYEAFPQPTIVQGILSRLRTWESVGITYFQTDATAIGGQSGGALVSEGGSVIGISGFRITEGNFGLVASTADLLPRIRQLIDGEDPAALGERRLPLEGGKHDHVLTMQSDRDAYVINEPADTAIDFELSGEDDVEIRVFDSYGDELLGAERGSFITEVDGPHFLIVSQAGSGEATLTVSHPLARFDDPDFDRQIQVGHSLRGNIDFPGDIDSFLLHLEKDEKVEIVARSALADTYITIDYTGATEEEQVSDDDSGRGLFGLDAGIVYRAPHTGEYVLLVENLSWSAPGGYVISVDGAQKTVAPSPLVPMLTINILMEVREGPGANYPILGAAAPGEQYVITGKDAAGDWWQMDFDGQLGWVEGRSVIPTDAGTVEVVAGTSPALARPVPVVSVHNPLVIPIGDTPAVSGGDLYDWPAFEDETLGLKVFYPTGWLFAPSKERLPSLLPQMGDPAIAELLLDAQAAYIDSVTPAGQADQFAGISFQFDQASPQAYMNGFHLLAIPAADRTLGEFTQLLTDRLEESESVTVENVEVGPGLRPWGQDVASIRYRTGGVLVFEDTVVVVPGTEVVGWNVVLLSPDGETFLVIAFDVWGEDFAGLERLLRQIVRRVQWVNQPAYEPTVGPTVTVNRTMNVRGGPSTNHPIVGSASAEQQYAGIGKNAAGDWWQIVYDGRLAWVYAAFVTPSADVADAQQPDSSGWLAYEDDARGLSLSYPSGWRLFDPAQPSQADLILFSAAREGEGEQLDIAELAETVSAMSVRREDAVIGLGLQLAQPDSGPEGGSAPGNFMLVYSFPANGLTLERYSQIAADLLQNSFGVETDSVELARGLRPLGDEAVSIRYRESVTNSEVWQVWLLSPDAETFLALAFSVQSDEFAALEPLLSEIVQRVQWTQQSVGAVATCNQNLNVHRGPGTEFPVIGTATEGQRLRIAGKDSDGGWWQIEYDGQPGWVFGQQVTTADAENVAVAADIPEPPPPPTDPVVTIDRNMNVRSGPGTFYSVLGTATPGEQFLITGKNTNGSWWRINYNDQSGWVFVQLVTAAGPLEDVPLIDSFDWDAFYDSDRRLWIFYPPGWFFFDPSQPTAADRRNLADLIGRQNAEEMLGHFASVVTGEERETFVGYGFEIVGDSFMLSFIYPSNGVSLQLGITAIAEGMRASGLDVDSAEVVTNLRYDGTEVGSIHFRDNRAGLGSKEIDWQVWMLSPDGASILVMNFSFHEGDLAEMEPLLSELVRRIRWE